MRDGSPAAGRILRRAERLLARLGPEHMKLEDIPEAAEHFSSMEDLIEAVSARRVSALAESWEETFDELNLREAPPPRQIVLALTAPIFELMDDEAGRDWICVAAHLSALPRYHIAGRPVSSSAICALFFGLLYRATDEPPRRLADSRLQLFAATLYQSMAFRIRAEDQRTATHTRALFYENLIDVVTAILTAPPSTSTERLLKG